jgi:hypothetical protein
MAKYSLEVYTNSILPNAQGVKITWTDTTTAAPVGMKVKIENSDAVPGTNKYGGWVASTPKAPAALPPPVTGWTSMNPNGDVVSSKEVSINLANGPAYIFPTYQIGAGDWKYYPTISIATSPDDPPSAVADGQLRGATGITISVLGGGGGPA